MDQTRDTGHDDLLLIGTIGVPFGVRGQVRLHTITSRPEHLRRVKSVFLGDHRLQRTLQRAVEHKTNVFILTLGGVESREDAEALRGTEVFIREQDAAPLDADEYFLHDLPGLAVETTSGEHLGTVKDVLETGANEVLLVTTPEDGELLIPMIRDIVKLLDIPGRRIVIEPIEGLLS
ncbi:MAG TPA: ribosome maturation factor RimM [Herpetosiphonaceae bacterium]|nr:ribosome maturation factor RimM [Herpetosiphonaceae bacterium]